MLDKSLICGSSLCTIGANVERFYCWQFGWLGWASPCGIMAARFGLEIE